jgi:hypothetical protein
VVTLFAADGASFGAVIEKADGEARASYTVTLGVGSDCKFENGSKVFASEREATAWIEYEATTRGFTAYPLSIKYPPGSSNTAALDREMVGLSHRWRL